MASATIPLSEVIGKTLYAKANIPLKRLPQDSAQTVYTVTPPNSVGVVYSYIVDKDTPGIIWWMFKDGKGAPYYAKHNTGIFDFKALKDQGLKTSEEIQKEKNKEKEPLTDFIERNLKTIVIVVTIGMVAKAAVPELFKRLK